MVLLEVISSQGHLLLFQGCHGINQFVIDSIYKSVSERVLQRVSVSFHGWGMARTT